jgi:hypothetical protein
MVVGQPPKGLGTINDMWFGWIIDIGFPGPDRGEVGKYLLLPPGYDRPLPDASFCVGQTARVIYAARTFLTDNDPKPTAELIKKTSRFIPNTGGWHEQRQRSGKPKVEAPAGTGTSAPPTLLWGQL